MEEKIRQYVNYRFRFDRRPDVEELKEEIIANLINRYYEKLNAGKTEEEAYVESIPSMGNFSEYDNVPYEYSFKPSFSDIFLVCSVMTSIFSSLLTFVSSALGILVLMLSMLFFGSAARYLYAYSQYVRKEELDIPKHNLLITKIFKYVKTNFIFWAISFSLIFTRIIMGLLQNLIFLELYSLTIEDIIAFIVAHGILFILFLILFGVIFWMIYHKLMVRYEELTGEKLKENTVKNSLQFVFGARVEPKLSKFFNDHNGIALLAILLTFSVLNAWIFIGNSVYRFKFAINQYPSYWRFLLSIFTLPQSEFIHYFMSAFLLVLAFSSIGYAIYLLFSKKKTKIKTAILLFFYVSFNLISYMMSWSSLTLPPNYNRRLREIIVSSLLLWVIIIAIYWAIKTVVKSRRKKGE